MPTMKKHAVKLAVATLGLVAVLFAIVIANHQTSQRAAEIVARVTHYSGPSLHSLHDMRFGVARVVSSINERIVIAASREGYEGTEGEQSLSVENRLIEEGVQRFQAAAKRFKEGYKGLSETETPIYADQVGLIEARFDELMYDVNAIVEATSGPFDAAKIALLKEQLEESEQAAFKVIEDNALRVENSIADLRAEQALAVRNMSFQTVAMGALSIFAVLVFSWFAESVLRREVQAHKLTEQTAEALKQAIVEKEKEMARRIELERELAHKRKLESLGTLAGGIAHELNNQLTPVFMMAESVRDRLELDDPNRTKLDLVCESTTNAKRTLSKVLELSRRSAGAEVVDIADVYRRTEGLLRAACPSHVTARFDSERLSGQIEANADDLQGVLVNLFSNAVDALEGRPGTVGVVCDVVDVGADQALELDLIEGRYARIAVEDTAGGMEKETMERVFDPFFTTKPPGSGVGLGLSLAQQSAQQAGGKVVVETELGRGSRFSVYLRLLTNGDGNGDA